MLSYCSYALDRIINSIDLRKCPFCGRPGIIVMHPGYNWDGKEPNVNIGGMHGLWYVGCSYTFFKDIDNNIECKIHPAAQWYADLSTAIKIWNRKIDEQINSK